MPLAVRKLLHEGMGTVGGSRAIGAVRRSFHGCMGVVTEKLQESSSHAMPEGLHSVQGPHMPVVVEASQPEG